MGAAGYAITYLALIYISGFVPFFLHIVRKRM